MNLSEVKSKLEFDKITGRILHYTYSPLGADKCVEIEFITDLNDLRTELDKVAEMKNILSLEGDLPLDGLKDIREIISKIKIEGFFISPSDFLDVLEFLRISRKLKNFFSMLSKRNDTNEGYCFKIAGNLFFDKILEHNIEITIDENGNVKDNASSVLNKIRKQINSQSSRLRKSLASILKRVSEKEYSQEDIITQRDGRYVIPVKTENKKFVQGIIHSSSASGATVFIEPTEIIELNNDLTELYFEEKREIENILRELVKQLRASLDELKLNTEILSEIDFIQAKARYAIELISVMPFIDKSSLNLKNAYHPVLLKSHKRSEVVPLNLELGENFNTLVISGPNAGGKTVTLKTVGLIQIMLQSGILVPVNPDSEFRLFKKIFISIGDEQSLENDLSTFSSHLKSIREIMEKADDDSLVLIDEIASGTDPVLGSALSASILNYLSEKNAYTIVTTHNSELKEFAYNTDKIENGSLEFNIQTLSPNFNFITGIPGQSFTFEIAGKFDFPEKVLKDAYDRLDVNESRLEDLLKELNEAKQKYSDLKNKFDIDNSRLKGLISLYEQKLNEIKKNEKELKFKAKIEAENIIKNANKLVENTIKKIREDKLQPKEIKAVFKSESEKILSIEEDVDSVTVLKEEIKINDTVRFKGTNSTGEVIDIINGKASVNSNGIVIKTSLNELEKISFENAKRVYGSESSVEINSGDISISLDIRGKYPDEITDEVEKFILDSVKYGLHEVSIIHGKGTGKLREKVHLILKGMNIVKSYRLGSWNEGDTGVTIAEL